MPVATRQEDLLVEKEKLGAEGEVTQAACKVALLRHCLDEDNRYWGKGTK